MHISPVLISSLVFSLSGCVDDSEQVQEFSQPIINGEACDEAELPQTVALLVDATFTYDGFSGPLRALLCTGTLIAPDTVLTAAHCLDTLALTGGFGTVTDAIFYVSTLPDLTSHMQEGEDVVALPADAVAAHSYVTHEQFSLTADLGDGLSNFYDIGLLFLETPISRIEPSIVMTPEEAVGLAVGDEVRIAGWGQRSPDGPSGLKHCATANIFELGDFEMQIGNEPSTSRKCHGDSGGPTFITIESDTKRKDRVIGATSRAYDSSDCLRGGVDTMASAWYAWIDGHMKSRCEATDRVWCDVAGVIPPNYYDDPVDPGGDDGDDGDDGGCGCSTNSGATPLFGVLLAALFWRRRRWA